FRLSDFSRERGHLLGANAGIDMIARGFRGGELRARLGNRRGQLDGGQLGDDVASTHAGARLDLDRGELTADLGRDTDFGCAYDAHDRRRRLAAPQEIGAHQSGKNERSDGDGLALGHAASPLLRLTTYADATASAK